MIDCIHIVGIHDFILNHSNDTVMLSYSLGFSGRALTQNMGLGLRMTMTLWGNINSQCNHINSYTCGVGSHFQAFSIFSFSQHCGTGARNSLWYNHGNPQPPGKHIEPSHHPPQPSRLAYAYSFQLLLEARDMRCWEECYSF